MEGYKKLLAYAPEKKLELVLSILLSAISALAKVGAYYAIWKFLEVALAGGDHYLSSFYGKRVVLLLIAYIITYFVGLLYSHLLGFRVESNLRKKSAKEVVNASFHFFDNNSSGEVRKKINENAGNTHMIIAHMIPDITASIVTPILMIIMAFTIDIFYGILIIFAVIFAVICMKVMMSDMSFMQKYLQVLERMNGETVEYVRGMQVIKIFGATVYTIKNFYEVIKEYSSLTYQHALKSKVPYVSFQTVLNLYVAFMIPYGIFAILRGGSIMEIVAKVVFFAIFGGVVFFAFTKVMYVGSDMFMAKQAVDKMEELFNEMDEKKIKFGTDEKFLNTDIEFKNVSFSYGNEPVLEDLSFKLKGGKSYALVGGSGSGKSTIAKLIGGFYEIDSGEILIGGKRLQDYSEEFINKKIAMVFQNAKLFNMSVFENVQLARPDANREEVLRALKDASCDDILNKLPQGVDTIIGSEGVSLSGGEVQRIAIARAILKDAEIVILDEASAAADADNEYQIQLAFKRLMKDKTVIMIAHRLSSIKNVDEILLIDEGLIKERGSHSMLMHKDTEYKKLQEMYERANNWRVSHV